MLLHAEKKLARTTHWSTSAWQLSVFLWMTRISPTPAYEDTWFTRKSKASSRSALSHRQESLIIHSTLTGKSTKRVMLVIPLCERPRSLRPHGTVGFSVVSPNLVGCSHTLIKAVVIDGAVTLLTEDVRTALTSVQPFAGAVVLLCEGRYARWFRFRHRKLSLNAAGATTVPRLEVTPHAYQRQ